MPPSAFLIAAFEFVLLLFSLSFHECAHAWTASRLGDQTARLQGRITLNPMYHIDPIGTLLFPALIIFGPLFSPGFSIFGGFIVGWARPTPVITRNFRKLVRDDNLTTLAGPASNLVLVAIAIIVLAVMTALHGGRQVVQGALIAVYNPAALAYASATLPFAHPVALICSLAIVINLSLFFFNLLPIPPLDGSRLLRNVLPYNAVQVYDRLNIWIAYLLMIVVGGFILRLLLEPSLRLVFAIFGI